MELHFFALSLWLYLVAAGGFVLHLVVTGDKTRRVALWVLTIAFACHTLALVLRETCPVAAHSSYDQVSVFAWFIVGVYLLLQIRYRLVVVGALVSPLAFLLTLSAYMVYSGVETLPRNLQDAWLPAHVAPAFLGYAVFTVAFCVSVVYLLQENFLKTKRRGGMFRRLPPLEVLDDLNHRFVTWGFALFTLGIITGSLLGKIRSDAFLSWEPVQVLSLMTWLVYAIQLQARSSGWRGRRAAMLAVIGFVLIVVSFVALGFGWHSEAPD